MNEETIKRYIYLEEKLKEYKEQILSENRIKSLTKLSFIMHEVCAKEGKYLNISDEEYLTYAYIMPIDEMTKEIERYDLSKPKLDELKFISSLASHYNVDRNIIIRRIQEVRKINRLNQIELLEKEKHNFSVLAVPCDQALVLPSNHNEFSDKEHSKIAKRAKTFKQNNLSKKETPNTKPVQKVKVRKKVIK